MKNVVPILTCLLAIVALCFLFFTIATDGATYLTNIKVDSLATVIGALVLVLGWTMALLGCLFAIVFTIYAYNEAEEHKAFD